MVGSNVVECIEKDGGKASCLRAISATPSNVKCQKSPNVILHRRDAKSPKKVLCSVLLTQNGATASHSQRPLSTAILLAFQLRIHQVGILIMIIVESQRLNGKGCILERGIATLVHGIVTHTESSFKCIRI